MANEVVEEKVSILKRRLGGNRRTAHLSTSQIGKNLTARLEFSEAATEMRLARVVSVAEVDDLNHLMEMDALEGVRRDFLARGFGFANGLRELVPEMKIQEV